MTMESQVAAIKKEKTKRNSRKRAAYKINTVDNTLRLLEIFSEKSGDVSLTEISARLDLSTPSVYRMLATFVERGYVRQNLATGKYRLGLPAYEMGQKFLAGMELLKAVRPALAELSKRIDEAVYVAIRDGDSVLMLDMVDTTQVLRIMPLVGRRYPLRSVSAGQVMIGTPVNCDIPVSDGQTEADWLREQICSDVGAFGVQIASVAIPVYVSSGEISCSICIVAPDFRLAAERVNAELIDELCETAIRVSTGLGRLTGREFEAMGGRT